MEEVSYACFERVDEILVGNIFEKKIAINIDEHAELANREIIPVRRKSSLATAILTLGGPEAATTDRRRRLRRVAG